MDQPTINYNLKDDGTWYRMVGSVRGGRVEVERIEMKDEGVKGMHSWVDVASGEMFVVEEVKEEDRDEEEEVLVRRKRSRRVSYSESDSESEDEEVVEEKRVRKRHCRKAKRQGHRGQKAKTVRPRKRCPVPGCPGRAIRLHRHFDQVHPQFNLSDFL